MNFLQYTRTGAKLQERFPPTGGWAGKRNLDGLGFLGDVGQSVHGAPVEGGLAHQLGDTAPVHGGAEGGAGPGKEDPGAVVLLGLDEPGEGLDACGVHGGYAPHRENHRGGVGRQLGQRALQIPGRAEEDGPGDVHHPHRGVAGVIGQVDALEPLGVHLADGHLHMLHALDGEDHTAQGHTRHNGNGQVKEHGAGQGDKEGQGGALELVGEEVAAGKELQDGNITPLQAPLQWCYVQKAEISWR